MMPTFEIFYVPAALGASLLVGFIVLAWEWRAAARLRAERRDLEERVLAVEEGFVVLRREIQAGIIASARLGKRQRRQRKLIERVGERARQLELRADESRAYDQAISCVRQGADAAKLVMNFGLSRGEAELVTLVHGQRRAS